MSRDTVIKYFAYGSNMNPERMIERGAVFSSMKSFTLFGYELRFNKGSRWVPGAGCANIVPIEGGAVEGVLYDIGLEGLYALDGYEGYPAEYDRVRLELDIQGIKDIVKTYMARPDKIRDGALPTREYLEHLLRAGEFLSEHYYEALRNHRTFD